MNDVHNAIYSLRYVIHPLKTSRGTTHVVRVTRNSGGHSSFIEFVYNIYLIKKHG